MIWMRNRAMSGLLSYPACLHHRRDNWCAEQIRELGVRPLALHSVLEHSVKDLFYIYEHFIYTSSWLKFEICRENDGDFDVQLSGVPRYIHDIPTPKMVIHRQNACILRSNGTRLVFMECFQAKTWAIHLTFRSVWMFSYNWTSRTTVFWNRSWPEHLSLSHIKLAMKKVKL